LDDLLRQSKFKFVIDQELGQDREAGKSPIQDHRHTGSMKMTSLRRAWICLLALGTLQLGVLITPPAKAQDYPNQTLKMVVPFVAGGGVDVAARIIAPKLGEELGQSVIIENRGGAGGMLGAAAVAQAPPDGYTLLVGTGSTHGTNSNVYARITYDPVRDFVPVVLLTSSPLLLIVPPSLPAKNVGDLIALGQSRPGELSFGSYGTGSLNHLGAELFNSMAKIQANHVPYRGSAPAMTDLIAGRLNYMFDGVSTSLGYLQAGTIRVLGVAGLNRSPVLPDLPTISEAGLVRLVRSGGNAKTDR
jgi:tripartite-type tricarboxylate transporter receptor subunit TctC